MLGTFSRHVVGWSIDSSQTATLVTSALSMAIDNAPHVDLSSRRHLSATLESDSPEPDVQSFLRSIRTCSPALPTRSALDDGIAGTADFEVWPAQLKREEGWGSD